MGNSGSINNISADDITAYHYRQRLRDANLDHLPMHWQNSYIKEPQPQPQPHIKVLPELNEGPRLRTTHNGAILHSGGTISGRRESAPPPLLQRARTSINIEMTRNREERASSRMHAQLSMLPNPDSHKPNYKRFGSEPDLRNSVEEETRPVPAPNPTRMSKSKMVKSKKKNPAPAPPVHQPVIRQQSARDFNANRFGWQPPPQGNQNTKDAPQKKLRLFKTKAESKRTSSQLKLASESSDSQFSIKPVEKPKEPLPKRPIQTSKVELKPKQPEPPSWKDNKVKVLPPPVYRREKTFDVSLLPTRSVGTDEAIKNAREKLKSTNVQRPVDDMRLNNRQKSLEPERPAQKSLLDVKLKMRKHSQQTETTTTFDFKKELEEATKRRSLAVETLEKQVSSNKEATSSDSGVGDRPVPKTRVNRTKRQNDVQKKEKAPTKAAAAPVKKTSEVKKVIETKKEKTPVRETKPTPISIEEKKRSETKIPQLTKTFYFGMENTVKRESPERSPEVENFGKIQMEVIDQFAKSIMTNQRLHRASSESSESALSSEECCPIPGTSGSYDDTSTGGIQLHVRPTLPRRQLEIPRFSPAAAWRMLNDEQKEILLTNKAAANAFINEFSENSNQPIEERIQRVYREPIPAFQDNKSGDSGISGDAGLPDRGDSPRRLSQDHGVEMRDKVGPFLTPWTPQQDLEEETSSDGELQKEEELNKYPSRAHVFSLSLPRESHLPVTEDKDKPGFSSLQKLKRTVSGAFTNNPDRMESFRSDNWLLSRSAPNSIENSIVAPASPQRIQQDEKEALDRPINIVQPSFSYLTGGKHVMYLPHYPLGESNDFSESEKQEKASSNASNSKGHSENKKKAAANQKKRESLQDVPPEEPQRQSANKGKGHRFTFQSTVRQIERRRIAEKLSKEAEQKEVQRLSELEAMRRVEEEFQRKRAREKASIRHQLRLFSMEESQCTSLPVDWQTNQQNQRADPDGASPTPSPTSAEDKLKTFYDEIECMNVRAPFSARILEERTINKNGVIHQMPKTEILSEFQTPRRNYMDHRGDKKYEYQTRQMEHPPIVCHIPPKSDQDSYTFEEEMINHGGHNVNRDSFPPGFRGRSLCSSDSDMSSPSGGVIEQKQQFRSRYRYYYDLH